MNVTTHMENKAQAEVVLAAFRAKGHKGGGHIVKYVETYPHPGIVGKTVNSYSTDYIKMWKVPVVSLGEFIDAIPEAVYVPEHVPEPGDDFKAVVRDKYGCDRLYYNSKEDSLRSAPGSRLLLTDTYFFQKAIEAITRLKTELPSGGTLGTVTYTKLLK